MQLVCQLETQLTQQIKESKHFNPMTLKWFEIEQKYGKLVL